MNFFVTDAFILGLKEAVKLTTVWFLFQAYLRNVSSERFLKPFYAGLALTTLVFGSSFFWPPEKEIIGFFSSLVEYVFFIFFMGSLIVLYIELSRKGRDIILHGMVSVIAVLVLTILYFSPDIISSSLRIRELAFMRENVLGAYLSGGVAFLLPLITAYVFLRRRGRALGAYLGLGELLLVFALIKLLGGGPGTSSHLSLIPAVQRGAMKSVHDFIHQIFVFIMVPDHPLFNTRFWTYIGFLFGSNFGLAAALALMLLPPSAYLYAALSAPLPEPGYSTMPSERRKLRARARREIHKKALPVAVFILVVFALWYIQIGTSATGLYLPQPEPVVADKGKIIIPLTDPTMDLMDGSLHKFSITRGADTIRFLVIKRPDGKLAVALDACEICPPEGYGLSGDKVVCLYCRTPIPVSTIGKEGGCNPIPLRAEITDKDIRIDVSELDAKWQSVKSGKTKGAIR